MTTLYTKSDGPAVLSSALLDAFDAFAQSLVAHPHRMTPEMWPKGWPFFEAGWNAAILVEREACARLCDAREAAPLDDEAPLVWLRAAEAIRERSNAEITGLSG